jgi:predicted anti-sigma-YlaC factor YlaD
MDCNEFMEIMNDDSLFFVSNQAERAIVYHHFMNCESCRKVATTMPFTHNPEAKKLAEEDYKVFKLFSEN